MLVFGGIFFIIWFSWNLLWPGSSAKARSPFSIAIEGAIVALLWGATMVFGGPILRTSSSYKLLVDEESITAVTERSGWMHWWVHRRTVRKGKVRTIFGIGGRFGSPRGIGVSERGKLGARLWGFVCLPESMPEFEQLKRMAESWRTPESAN
jgi:hypothetical protein